MAINDKVPPGFLDGIRVLEIGAEIGEYTGKLLAGLGADVVRVEPPGGEQTRTYGPFYHDEPNPDRSLYFWHYNLGKRSIVLDLDSSAGQKSFAELSKAVDVVIDSRPRDYLSSRGLGSKEVRRANPALIYLRISPFGDDGPWADFAGSDLVHLALGGVMMNCGYDPDPFGDYDTPPIAPQMWQSYQLVGETAVISVLSALNYRFRSGCGQYLSASVHEAVSKNTETDMPNWVYLRQRHMRQTCRHSAPMVFDNSLSITKDGRYVYPYRTYLPGSFTVNAWDGLVSVLAKYGMQEDLGDSRYDDDSVRFSKETADRTGALLDKLVLRLPYSADVWRDGQSHGLPWAPIRRPEENLYDDHWRARDSFFEIYHPELDETFTYTGAKWLTHGAAWRHGPRPPLVGEHTEEVLSSWTGPRRVPARAYVSTRMAAKPLISRRGKPFALSDVRVIDLSWMLASAGAGRFLAAMGAEVIKIEHESRPDGMRYSPMGTAPPDGRKQREEATEAIPTPPVTSGNRSGNFMEINSGKLGLSLNIKNPEGRKILECLIRDADMIVEGFSPGTMERMGLGYDRLKEINPSIIYVQQSGLGEVGTYGRARTYGPTAAAFSGISDMSGLPSPYPPAGIGYSYLDWCGAYNMASAMLAALYRRNATGEGCHIDSSQGEAGLYMTGTSILDYTVNGRSWSRYGNRSPYKKAAPHGVYRTAGDDRWIAIAAFTEQHWRDLVATLGHGAWTEDERCATLTARLENQDLVDEWVSTATRARDGFELMSALQDRNVPAGVCQTAQDRYEIDPQLAHLEWLVELPQTEIGTWPVKEHPVQLSETPAYIGGRLDRSGPNYGEDTDYVLGEILKLTPAEIVALREKGAV